MRNRLFLCSLLLLTISFSTLCAQSKKLIRDLQIKTSSTEQIDFKNGIQENKRNVYLEYDKNGNTTLEIEYNADSSFKKKEHNEYNRQNNPLKTIRYDTKGAPIETVCYQYDAFGNKISETTFNEKEIEVEKTTYSYNGFGLKTQEVTPGVNEKIKRKVELEYDGHGALKERRVFDEKGEPVTIKKYFYHY